MQRCSHVTVHPRLPTHHSTTPSLQYSTPLPIPRSINPIIHQSSWSPHHSKTPPLHHSSPLFRTPTNKPSNASPVCPPPTTTAHAKPKPNALASVSKPS